MNFTICVFIMPKILCLSLVKVFWILLAYLINVISSYETNNWEIDSFVPDGPFIYPLEASENLTVFLCFQGLEKEWTGNKWVKYGEKFLIQNGKDSKNAHQDLVLLKFTKKYIYIFFNFIKKCLCYININTATIFLHDILPYPVSNYLLKVNNRNTRTRCEICSKLTIKTPERRHLF